MSSSSSSRARRWLAALACWAVAGGAVLAAPPQGRVEDAGVRLDWRYEAQDAAQGVGLGRLVLEVSDSATGAPLRLAPGQVAAWLQRSRGTLSEGELACRDKVKQLVGKGVGRRADIDLNTWRIVTLNDDRTLAFINPFVGLNNAKLESIVALPGEPVDWVHLPQRLELWVRLSAPDRLVAVDTHARRIVRTLELPADSAPGLALDEANGRLWLAQRDQLAWLDLADPRGHWQRLAAPGVVAVRAVAQLDAAALLATHADGRVTQWQAGGGEPVRRWQLAAGVRGLAYSALARQFVAHDDSGLLLLDREGGGARRLDLGHPVGALALTDDGRHAMLTGAGRMSFVDLASGAVVARSASVDRAEAIRFTARFAYAISGAGQGATLWPLADLRGGRAEPVQVLLGSRHDAAAAAGPGLERAVPSPSGTGLLVANAADALVYQYAEGMMAPVGSYSNYRRAALALAVLDLSPRELMPGRYVAPLRHEAGGVYELVVGGAAPRFAACDRLPLAAPAGAPEPATSAALRSRLLDSQPAAAGRWRIVATLEEVAAGAPSRPVTGVPDLTLIVYDRRSGWQHRTALRERPAGSARYEADVPLPRAARYDLLAASVSQDLTPLQGRLATLPLDPAAGAP